MKIAAEAWEIYKISSKSISAEVEAGKLKIIKSSEGVGYAARVIVNSRVAFASSENVEVAVDKALSLAKVSEDRLDDFPLSEPARVKGIYDRRVEDVNSEFLKTEVETLVSTVEKAKIAAARIEHEVCEVEIRNSHGLECLERSTHSSVFVEGVYEEGSAYEIDESRRVDLDLERVAKVAEELAIESSTAVKIESGYYDVIFSPLALHQLFYYSLYPSFSAENVLKGRSTVKIGDELGKITLVDDPTVEGGLMSCSFDDEGVGGKKTILVEEGVVKSYYTDWKHSKLMKIEPTGNGFRHDYSSFPQPAPSNVIVEFNEKCDEEGAVIVHSLIGSHTSNPVSGDFSLEFMNASYGEKAIKGAMIYGNIFELIKKIEGCAGDVRQIENTISPSIRVSNLRVI